MNELINSIAKINASQANKDIVRGMLIDIENKFNVFSVKKAYPNGASFAIESILKFLTDAFCNSDANIRTQAQRTLCVFLSHSSAFYPKTLRGIFSEQSNLLPKDGNPYASLFIAVAFTWLTHDVDPIYLQDLYSNSHIVQYFSILKPEIATDIPTVISLLQDPPREFLVKLLNLFLEQLRQNDLSTSLIRAITAVILHNQDLVSVLFKAFREDNNLIPKSLPLISHLISNKVNLDRIHFDYTHFELIRSLLERHDNETMCEAAFQILSHPSASFSVSTKMDGSIAKLKVKLKRRSGGNPEIIPIKFDINSYNTASRFLLPLPLEFLTWDPKDLLPETKAKFSTISNIARTSKDPKVIEKTFDMFKFALQMGNNDKMPDILTRFSACCLVYLNTSRHFEFIALIRELIYLRQDIRDRVITKTQIHGLISAFTPANIFKYYDRNTYETILDYVIQDVLHPNDIVRSSALETLKAFSSYSKHELIIEAIFDRLDCFDQDKMEYSFYAVSILGEEKPDLDKYFLLPTLNMTIDLMLFNELPLSTLTLAMRYLSLFDMSSDDISHLGDIPIIVHQIITESVNHIIGTTRKTKSTRYDSNSLRKMIDVNFKNNPIEVFTSKPINNRISIFPHLYYALRLFRCFPIANVVASLFTCITDACVQIFPDVSSDALLRCWPLLVKTDRQIVLNSMTTHLRLSPNFDVASRWLKILMDPLNEDLIDQTPDFKNSFLVNISEIPSHAKNIQPSSLLRYTKFILNTGSDKTKEYQAAIEELSEDARVDFLRSIRELDENVVFELVDDPPELKVNFAGGLIESMRQMIQTTKAIYTRVKRRVKLYELAKSSIETREIIRDNLNVGLPEDLHSREDTARYISLVKFQTVDLSPSDLKRLIHYFCDVFSTEGIVTTLDHWFNRFSLNTMELIGQTNDWVYRFPIDSIPAIAKVVLDHKYKIEDFLMKYAPDMPKIQGVIQPYVPDKSRCLNRNQNFTVFISSFKESDLVRPETIIDLIDTMTYIASLPNSTLSENPLLLEIIIISLEKCEDRSLAVLMASNFVKLIAEKISTKTVRALMAMTNIQIDKWFDIDSTLLYSFMSILSENKNSEKQDPHDLMILETKFKDFRRNLLFSSIAAKMDKDNKDNYIPQLLPLMQEPFEPQKLMDAIVVLQRICDDPNFKPNGAALVTLMPHVHNFIKKLPNVPYVQSFVSSYFSLLAQLYNFDTIQVVTSIFDCYKDPNFDDLLPCVLAIYKGNSSTQELLNLITTRLSAIMCGNLEQIQLFIDIVKLACDNIASQSSEKRKDFFDIQLKKLIPTLSVNTMHFSGELALMIIDFIASQNDDQTALSALFSNDIHKVMQFLPFYAVFRTFCNDHGIRGDEDLQQYIFNKITSFEDNFKFVLKNYFDVRYPVQTAHYARVMQREATFSGTEQALKELRTAILPAKKNYY